MIWINKEHYGGICRNCDHEMAHFSIASDKNHSIEKHLPKHIKITLKPKSYGAKHL